jgi:transcriptional regulator GlxA family with amidase domain
LHGPVRRLRSRRARSTSNWLRFPLAPAQHDIALPLLDDVPHAATTLFAASTPRAKAFELLHTFLTRRFDDEVPARQASTRDARERLAPVKRYIDANLHEAFEMRVLAQALRLQREPPRAPLSRGLRLALFEYVGKARLGRARGLLEGGALSITQMALEVGYGHAANFSTAFKRHFGITPHSLRKAAREGRALNLQAKG